MVASLLYRVASALAYTLLTGMTIGALPGTVAAGTFDSPPGRRVVTGLTVIIGLFLLRRLTEPLETLIAESMQRRTNLYFYGRVQRAVLAPIGVAHMEDPAIQDLIRDASQGTGTGEYTPGGAVVGLLGNATARLNSIAQAVLVAQFSWWLAVLLVGFGIFARYRIVADMLRDHKIGAGQTTLMRRSDYLRDLALAPEAAKETLVFGLGGWILERFKTRWASGMQSLWDERKTTNVSSWWWSIPWGGLILAGMWLAGAAAIGGEITLQTMTVVTQAMLAAGVIWIGGDDFRVVYGARAIPAILKLESLTPESSENGTREARGLPGHDISFEHVTFHYPGQERTVLNDLDLRLEAGKSLAIVGVNGAGKTTLVKLLTRLYEPVEGRIAVDGYNLSEIDARAWQRRIAAIFQDFICYELPARANVGFGAVEHMHDDDALGRAVELIGARDVIERLPAGWDTVLSRGYKDGAELSGGQWQRLALARALFAVEAGASVLILDEPTANLDVRAEAELFDRFLSLTEGVTTILISHRFSTVRHASRICVLEDGRITEEGTHAELLALGGRYATMFSLQAERFVDNLEQVTDA